jgi:hypothetical protein
VRWLAHVRLVRWLANKFRAEEPKEDDAKVSGGLVS